MGRSPVGRLSPETFDAVGTPTAIRYVTIGLVGFYFLLGGRVRDIDALVGLRLLCFLVGVTAAPTGIFVGVAAAPTGILVAELLAAPTGFSRARLPMS